MVARRMRRLFLGANRPTNAASTISAPPRMRIVDGDAYPNHSRGRSRRVALLLLLLLLLGRQLRARGGRGRLRPRASLLRDGGEAQCQKESESASGHHQKL